jgi:hypothetical protein
MVALAGLTIVPLRRRRFGFQLSGWHAGQRLSQKNPLIKACDHVSWLHRGATLLAPLRRRVGHAIPRAQRLVRIPVECRGRRRRLLLAGLLARREHGARPSVAGWHVARCRATVSVVSGRARSSDVRVAPGPVRRGLRIGSSTAILPPPRPCRCRTPIERKHYATTLCGSITNFFAAPLSKSL